MSGDDFSLSGTIHLPNGDSGEIQIENMGSDINQMVHGFLGVDGLTQVATQALEKMRDEIWRRMQLANDQKIRDDQNPPPLI